MKKGFAWLLIALMALSLVPMTAQAADPVSIVFWHSMSESAGTLMEKYIKDFNDTIGVEKGIAVEAVFQGKYSDATAKLNSVLTSGDTKSLPDVMQIDATGKITYATSGAAYTVDDVLKVDTEYDLGQILKAPLLGWNYAGAQLGLPFSASTTVMYYNKTMLDAAGVAVPTTFAEIAALAGKLPAQTADGQKVYAMASVPNTPTLANWIGQMGAYVVDNMNGSQARATQLACIEDGSLQTFLTEWKAMYDAGALLNQGSGTTDMFVAGQLALLPTSSSNTTSLLATIGDKFELGVAFYPRVTDAAAYGATTSGAGVFMFDKGDDAQKAAAWELVKYLTSAAVQADFAVGTGYIPVNVGAAEAEAYKALITEKPIAEVAMQQLMQTPETMSSVTVGPSIDFYNAIADNISTMLDQGMTVEETLEIMAEELNALLADYNKANP